MKLAALVAIMFGIGFISTLAAVAGSWVAAWVVQHILLGRR